MTVPDKKYNIIYADPPWGFNGKPREGRHVGFGPGGDRELIVGQGAGRYITKDDVLRKAERAWGGDSIINGYSFF